MVELFRELFKQLEPDFARTGLRTDVVEDIEEESQGFRVISRALIPFVRPTGNYL